MLEPDDPIEPSKPSSPKPLIWIAVLLLVVGALTVLSLSDVWDRIFSVEQRTEP